MTEFFITTAEWIAAVERRRAELGWTQFDVEDAAGLGLGYLSKVVLGKKSPTMRTVERIDRVLLDALAAARAKEKPELVL